MRKKALWPVAILATLIAFYPMAYWIAGLNFGLLTQKDPELLASQAYRLFFFTHISFGGLALLTGWMQFVSSFRQKRPAIHRLLGKFYVISVILSGLAGLVVAFKATGGLVSVLGFILLGLVWLTTTIRAWLVAMQKDFAAHEKWMIYSYAACFAAVTLRLLLPLLIILHKGEFEPAYRIVAWLCWVPNLLVAYFLTAKKQKASAPSLS